MGKEIKLSNMISTIKSSRSMSYAKKFFFLRNEVINVFNNQENLLLYNKIAGSKVFPFFNFF